MPSVETDRIEKHIVLRAARSRVWKAISNAKEFGDWFRVAFDGEFREGTVIRGPLLYPGFEHIMVEILVVRMEPECLFSFRWHPDASDPAVDYSAEPTTLVEFRLEDAPDGSGGTALTLVESGFDAIPIERRAEAFGSNDGGWTEQMKNLERYVTDS